MISPIDHALITEQLGTVPPNALSVAAHCPAGHPSVITCYPLRRDGKRVAPFPTLYWLTCPHLRKQLSHLERDGAISIIAAELADDRAMQAGLLRDHENYIALRWAMLSPMDQSLVSDCGLLDTFKTRGIGGMSNFKAIKCLHLHVAHDLASGSTIGKSIAKRFGVQPCGHG